MERHEVLEMMATLKLAGMRAAFAELLADGLKRQHPVQRIIGELLKAEIADKRARSIKYQMSVAKLPLAKQLTDFRRAHPRQDRSTSRFSSAISRFQPCADRIRPL